MLPTWRMIWCHHEVKQILTVYYTCPHICDMLAFTYLGMSTDCMHTSTHHNVSLNGLCPWSWFETLSDWHTLVIAKTYLLVLATLFHLPHLWYHHSVPIISSPCGAPINRRPHSPSTSFLPTINWAGLSKKFIFAEQTPTSINTNLSHPIVKSKL